MPQSLRNLLISFFVIVWLTAFHYESIRYFYLQPLLKRELPKIKFLFPPAGWIMFYRVGTGFGYAQIYGVKDGRAQAIDPHQVLQTRAIGYDNINRNALITVLDQEMVPSVCSFLKRKFSYFDGFLVTYIQYPDIVKAPYDMQQQVMYECRK